MASSNRNRYLPTYIASINGTVVTDTPHRNRLNPSCCSPATKPGPEEMPTTAMNTFRPTEFMNQTVGDGIRPKVGHTERNQPKKSPEINTPPERSSATGQLPTLSPTYPSNTP